jgi:RNA polymerase sigma-70 factor (ECF subfamily)
METPSEELVQLCLNGDEDAWKQFTEEYRDLVYGICHFRSGTTDDVEDLMQEAFLKIWMNLASYDPARGALRAWISTVTRNAVLDRYRRNGKQRLTDSIDDALDESGIVAFGQVIDSNPTPHDVTASNEIATMVIEQGKKIPPEMWLIVQMRFLHELDNKEIAQQLRIPEGTVKSRASRGLARLALLLRPLELSLGAA